MMVWIRNGTNKYSPDEHLANTTFLSCLPQEFTLYSIAPNDPTHHCLHTHYIHSLIIQYTP